MVELLAVVDVANMASHMSAERALHVDTMVEDAVRASEKYLQAIAGTSTAAKINTLVDTGRPEEVIIEKAAAEHNPLITMVTQARSGINRWLLGSVPESSQGSDQSDFTDSCKRGYQNRRCADG